MNAVAESYVRLVLALGQHDPDYVDAYYGPPEWKTAAAANKRPLAEIRAEADSLLARLARIPEPPEELPRLRHVYLVKQISALRAKAEMLSGTKFTFDEESRALYDAVAPTNTEEHFRAIRDRLAAMLPGEGPLGTRYEAFRQGFVIPPDRLDAVFDAAIEAGRTRTKAHIPLPEGERFRVEKVTGKSWSGSPPTQSTSAARGRFSNGAIITTGAAPTATRRPCSSLPDTRPSSRRRVKT